jgi:hypothetical protein
MERTLAGGSHELSARLFAGHEMIVRPMMVIICKLSKIILKGFTVFFNYVRKALTWTEYIDINVF